MDKTKIDWCDSTWNPVTGCFHDCEYCYARGIAERFGGKQKYTNIFDESEPIRGKDGKALAYPHSFSPTFHRYRLNDYIDKQGRNIFVCSMADLFGEWVPENWIKEVFKACENAPQHNYLFLTKNPERYIELEKERKLPWAENFWFGSSITKPYDRYTWFTEKKFHWFLSVEPMLEDLGSMDEADLPKPEWIIVGAETGRRKDRVVPERAWIENLLTECRKYGIPLFMKSSLADIWGEPLIREFPKALWKGRKINENNGVERGTSRTS